MMSVGSGQACSPCAVAPLLAPVLGSLAGVTDSKSSEFCSETQHAQDLAQADKKVFGQSMMSSTAPSVDGQATFLG
jgi:hypothetical protein